VEEAVEEAVEEEQRREVAAGKAEGRKAKKHAGSKGTAAAGCLRGRGKVSWPHPTLCTAESGGAGGRACLHCATPCVRLSCRLSALGAPVCAGAGAQQSAHGGLPGSPPAAEGPGRCA
jgi:hypothetical protein